MSKLRKTLARTKHLTSKAPVAKISTVVYKNMQLKETKLGPDSEGRKFQTITSYPIYDLQAKKWLTSADDVVVEDPIPKVVIRNSLLAAIHGNILTAIGQVNPKLDSKAAPYLAAPIESKELPFPCRLDLGTNSRNHGRFIFTTGLKPGQEGNKGIGFSYFAKPEEQWKRIIYGSILNTNCRFLFWTKVKYVIVDDERRVDGRLEDDPTNNKAWGTGDSHCKVGSRLAGYFGLNDDEKEASEGEQTESKSNQLRFAIREQFCGKGTYSRNFELDTMGIDIAIPLSCLKGNKPELGNHEGVMVFGLVHEAEQRTAKASWMLWQWFKFETLEQDGIITNLTTKCNDLRDAQTSIYALTQYFAKDFKQASESLSDIDADPEGELAYIDKGIRVILADKSKLFYSHPYVHYLFKLRLASLWKKFATGAGVRFYSVMCMPDETFEKYQTADGKFKEKVFCSASFKPGKYIVFCNPMRHWGDCQVWENKREGKYVDEMGVLAATRELLLSLGRDFDGDMIQLIQAERYPNMVAEIESWDEPPKTIKFPKYPLKGNLAQVAASSMNDKTGIVASLLGKVRALGIERVVVNIPGNSKLNESAKEMPIIDFLSQQLQIAVDSLKSAYPNNDEGLEKIGELVKEAQADSGILAAPFISALKDKEVYVSRACHIYPDAVDTVSRIINIVNNNWQAQNILNEEAFDLLDFQRVIFNNPPFSSFDAAGKVKLIYEVTVRRCETYTTEIAAAFKVEAGTTGEEKVKSSKSFRQVLENARGRLEHDLETIKNPETGETYSKWEWAQAYWFKLHANSKRGKGSTSLVFNLFIDEILGELSKLQLPELINLPPIPFYGFQFAEFPHNWTRDNTPVGEILTIIFETTPDGKLGIRAKDSDNKFQFLAKVSESYLKQYYKNIVRGQHYLCYIFLIQHENDKIDKRKSLVHERSASDKPKGGLLVSAEVDIRRAVAAVRSQAGVEHLPAGDLSPNWVLPWQEKPEIPRNDDGGLKFLGKVEGSTLETLREFLRSLKDQMELDESNYAKGRRRMWIFHRPSLRNGDTSLKKAYFDQRLWDFCQRVFPGCNVGLISYGGDGSTGTIDWHRDHTYAQPIARTVNLGESIFGYDTERQGGNRQEYTLTDGQIVEFNSKHPHALIRIVSEERFGINLWKLNEAKGYYPLPLP